MATGGKSKSGPSKPQRTASSQRWLKRQHSDPFVAEARDKGYRSRAAFKLIEIDDKFRLLMGGKAILDLGAAPGGWSQIAALRVKAGEPRGGIVVAADLTPIDPIGGVTDLVMDLHDAKSTAVLRKHLPEGADVVLSDMAPQATGHRSVDFLRSAALAESAFATAEDVLKPGGAFVVKVMRSGADVDLEKDLKRKFREVKAFKPKSSRQDSAEMYLVARGYRPVSGEPAT